MASSIVQPSRLSAISSRAIRSQRGARRSPSQARAVASSPQARMAARLWAPHSGKEKRSSQLSASILRMARCWSSLTAALSRMPR